MGWEYCGHGLFGGWPHMRNAAVTCSAREMEIAKKIADGTPLTCCDFYTCEIEVVGE